MTELVFLWHMHQPYYKDCIRNTYLMPWVRLHALKGYYDIPSAMKKYGVKGVVNVVPSLIEQLKDYAENNVTDAWLEHTIADPSEMKEEQKAFVIKNFFMINWDRLVRTSPRYNELLNKRLRYEKKLGWNEMARLFSDDEILDLQVLFNLKWFGFTAKAEFERLAELERKDCGFTKRDKEDLLEIQRKVLRSIIPLYRRLADEGVIEISFTPFYHPIFPLVYDTDIAKRCMNAPLPAKFSYPEDAKWHLEEGKRYSEEVWGRTLNGMWPAEGSVAPEIIDAAADSSVKWMTTDETILLKSLGRSDKSQVLYTPYRLKSGKNQDVAIFFRDKYLSDLLGFSFSQMKPEQAADIFVNYVKNAAANFPSNGSEPVVSVIMDGENAWESYPDNGEHFLKELFTRLSSDSVIKTTVYSDIISRGTDKYPVINDLWSGSWINGNYEIWIGNDEDNAAWGYLKRVRDFYAKYSQNHIVEPQIHSEIMRCLYRAEGSDWFWWYGPQFSTENDWLFDRLFRRHLRRVYNLLGMNYPTFLDIPISSELSNSLLVEPTGEINPVISGHSNGYYEWAGAGRFENAQKAGGAMYNSIKLVDKILYGFNRDMLFFRIELTNPMHFYEHKKYFIKGFVMDHKSIDFALPMVRIEKTPFLIHSSNESGRVSDIVGAGEAAFDEVMEFTLYAKKIGLKPGEKVRIYFKILSNEGIELERIPGNGSIEVTVPDEAALFKLWDV